MKMTRQHFQAQADLCADILISLSQSVALTLGHIDDVIEMYCDMCADTNPQFDPQRFRTWVLEKLEIN
jgi:hypothetical protein